MGTQQKANGLKSTPLNELSLIWFWNFGLRKEETVTKTEILRLIQDHLQEGLLIVVGTGLSIAEGIPGMAGLASHLLKEVPNRLIPIGEDPEWEKVAAFLKAGDGLEHAMSKASLKASTVEVIVEATASLIIKAECHVSELVLTGKRTLPFTTFAKHLFKAGRQFHLITTNYDRLIELAAEVAGIGVDSRFFGYLHGRPEPKRSSDAHKESYISGKRQGLRPVQCLCVYKPHGSLDWYEIDGKVFRSPLTCNRTPVIITPGTSKYQRSFHRTFDDHRTAGNRCVENSKRLMFIGYGFNDDHLEQHLCPNLKLSKPTIIVARELSENAKRVLQNSKGTDVIALSAASDDESRTRVSLSSGEEYLLDQPIWNLEGFNQGVL